MTETNSQNRRLGYARVSTYGKRSTCSECSCGGRVQAGLPRDGRRRAGRPARTARMLKALRAGDVVTVTRIDRLARSTFDLFAIVKRIT
ncbi:MAG: recombinase family protein, partial [Pseudomonadota bacterium]|nr:recombinase family protein [Pseudomonadota bacterium]